MLVMIFLAFVASFLLTYAVRSYALRNNIIDTPNCRSSHTFPTPRGGGISIVLVSIGIFTLYATRDLTFLWLSLSTLFVGGIGYLDDRGHVHPGIRLIAHFAAAACVVIAAGGLPPLVVFGVTFELGIIGNLLAVIGVVWLLNLYNFMDGINGIASAEALTTMLTIAALMFFAMDTLSIIVELHTLLAASVLGFFVWNFPSAKIFMGDAGSGFLGTVVAALMLLSAQIDQVYFWAWLIVLGVFIVDATFTLLRRLLRGDKVYEAHCSHAYQRASRMCGSHTHVTLAVIAINVLWLAPMAAITIFGLVDGFLALLIAYVPLILLAVKYKAGALES